MSKRLFTLLSLLAIAAMLLAACGTPTQAPTEAPAPAATQAPPAAFTCSDKIGCVDVGPNDPIHIAYLLVVAGPNETLGVDSRNGLEIAIDDAGGKILNHDIKFDGEDGGCDAAPGQTAGAKLAADSTIVAVIGTSCSSEARAAVPLLSKAGFVIISASNTAPDLTEAGNANNYPGYLRTAHNDKVQGAVAAQFAIKKLGVKTAATIHDGSVYAEQLQAVFADELSDESVEELRPLVTGHWQALRDAMVPALTALIEADRPAGRRQDRRVRIGLYSFNEATPATTSSATASSASSNHNPRKGVRP